MAAHTIISYALLAAYISAVGATDYTVGDSNGWTISLNYMAWSTKYNFTVGDALLFNYVKGQHNVYDVTQDTFRSCNATNGTLKIYNSGLDTVNLTTAKEYWFICNFRDHCTAGGMKFAINVSELAALPPGDVTSPPPPHLHPPPPPSAAVRQGINWSYCAILLVILWCVSFH
ncbi:mavicyanin-like protein [Carex littledalei]|uniref:Mavicyanin-like protein n=1 Tax=Carex littledalei TaxID=544730 RepID=A0A833QTC7_9POAL|nr:mavicyanin-like protein [Carex littledalei]